MKNTEFPESIVLNAAIEQAKTDPDLSQFVDDYTLVLRRVKAFKNQYSAYDLKETLLNISQDDMKQVLGREADEEMWDNFRLAMRYLWRLQDDHLAALIEFHKLARVRIKTTK